VIRFTVLGTPSTQGNKSGFVNKHTGKVVMREGRSKEASERFHSWREAVRSEAQDYAETFGLTGPCDGRVAVHLQFMLQRPSSAPKTRRTWPIGARSGDIDKLARAVLDSLTGVLFADDAQVTELVVTKDYGTPGVIIEVYTADELNGQLEVVS